MPSRGPIWLVVRGGSRDGEVLSFDQERITVGRSPEADVRFDPQLDRAVSAHQAVVAWGGQGWFVRDLASRNGTWVGGARIDGDAPVAQGSLITLGLDGPSLSVHERPPTEALAGVARDTSAPEAPSTLAQASPAVDGVTERIRVEVGRETRRLRFLVLGLAVTLAAVFVFGLDRTEPPPSWEAERAALLQFVDSVLRTSDESGRALEGELDALADALVQSQDQVRALRRDLESAQRSEDDSDGLRTELQAATLALQRQQLAAAVEYDRIAEASRSAVAAVWVDFGDGDVLAGTAFLVADGLLATSAHLVSGRRGDRTPERVAVQFAGRTSIRSAQPAAASRVHDVALLRLDGDPPTVDPLGLNARPDTIAEGRPVVLIGYPLGGAEPSGATGSVSTPILSIGLLMESTLDEIRIQGYGAEGASGSPIFDETGAVVGVLRGGVRGAPVQTVLGVSSTALRDLLSALP